MTHRIIRHSEINKFMDCRRAWYNGYYLQLGLPDRDGDTKPGTASCGNLIHSAMEHYYFYGTDPVAWLDTQPVPEGTFAKEWTDTFVLARIMLNGYINWLEEGGHDAGETTVGTEIALEMPMGTVLGDEVTLVIHMDRLIKDETWNRWIIDDFKSVQTLTKGLEFDIDLQGLTYALVVRNVLGITVDEFRHTMLRRVKQTASAKPPFYAREPMTINASQFDARERQLRGVIRDMVEVYQALDADPSAHQERAYPRPTNDCSWKCDFLTICGMHDNGKDVEGMRNLLYIKRKNKGDNN